MHSKLILGILLGIGFFFSTVTTVSYVDAQESLLDASDDIPKYKPPLRQIRDNGVLPQDVKCNEGKVLFFKIKDKSPVCIYENSIEKLSSRIVGWFFGDHITHYVDYDYLYEKENQLDRTITISYESTNSDNRNITIIESIDSKISTSQLFVPYIGESANDVLDVNGNSLLPLPNILSFNPNPLTPIPDGVIPSLTLIQPINLVTCDNGSVGIIEHPNDLHILFLPSVTHLMINHNLDSFLNQQIQNDTSGTFTDLYYSYYDEKFEFIGDIDIHDIEKTSCSLTGSISNHNATLYAITYSVGNLNE